MFKRDSELYRNFSHNKRVDRLGNPFPPLRVDTLPQVPRASAAHFSTVVGADLWKLYSFEE